MKRSILVLTAFILAFSLCACGNNNGELTAADGQKLAGIDAGNNAVDYSFVYPEEWEMVRNDGVIELQYDCNASDAVAEYATLTVLAFTLSDGIETAKQYWDSQKEDTAAVFQDFKELDTQEYDTEEEYVGGTPALKVKYSGKMNGRTYISDQIIVCRYGEVYLITLVVPEEYYDSASSVLTTVKDSIKFA